MIGPAIVAWLVRHDPQRLAPWRIRSHMPSCKPMAMDEGRAMICDTLAINTDFCGDALELGAINLAVRLCDLTVWAPLSKRIQANRLQGEFGFELVLVPDCLLPTAYAWAVQAPGGNIIWSPGC